jgi:predicted transcriptional regulator
MLKTFLKGHLAHGELKKVALRAGIHQNSVYAWVKGRNQPSVVSLIWFFRALSEIKNKDYVLLWIEYLFVLEGSKNARKEVQEWLQNQGCKIQESHEQEEEEEEWQKISATKK